MKRAAGQPNHLISISLIGLSIILGVGLGSDVLAADYPNRSITIVVPYAPGGVTDLGARAVADGLERHLKQSVVVVNRPGGATTVGGNAVASAKPDGYTLGFLTSTASIPEVFTYFFNAPYSSKQLRPICRVVQTVTVAIAKGDSPFKTFKDVVEFARKNPGMKVANNGKGTRAYAILLGIGRMEKVEFVGVPYPGDTEIIPAVLGGHVPLGILAYPAARPLIEAKKLKGLLLSTPTREFDPDVPTLNEYGYKDPWTEYNALFGPAGIPDEAVKKIDEAVGKTIQEEAFRKRIANMGSHVNYESNASFEKSVAALKESLATLFKEEGWVKQ